MLSPAPKVRKKIALLPPSKLENPAKGVVPPPAAVRQVISTGVPAAGAASAATWWDWVAAHPWEATAIAAGGVLVLGGGVYLVNRWHRLQQEAPTPALAPVAA